MQWAIVGIAAFVLAGGIWAATALGNPAEQEAQGGDVDLRQMRQEQVLSNELFEIVPGEVLISNQGEMTRYDIRARITNMDPTRTLQNSFWDLSVTAYNSDGEPTEATASLPPWSSFGRQGGGVRPGVPLTGNILITAKGAETLSVTLTYAEPNRVSQAVTFLYPYGN